jgi:hypothetical protein
MIAARKSARPNSARWDFRILPLKCARAPVHAALTPGHVRRARSGRQRLRSSRYRCVNDRQPQPARFQYVQSNDVLHFQFPVRRELPVGVQYLFPCLLAIPRGPQASCLLAFFHLQVLPLISYIIPSSSSKDGTGKVLRAKSKEQSVKGKVVYSLALCPLPFARD